jgi:hypothetical protein
VSDTVARVLAQQHPREVTIEWAVLAARIRRMERSDVEQRDAAERTRSRQA